MGFLPTYLADSISVLIGTTGGGVMTAGSAALGPVGFTPLPGHTTAQYFSSADVGRIVTVLGAGPSGGILVAKIASYVDTQNVVLDTNASTSVTSDVSNVTVFRPCAVKLDSFEHEASASSRDTGRFTVESVTGAFVPVEGQPVLFASSDPAFSGYTYGVFFGGTIDSIDVSNAPGSSLLETSCDCISWETLATKRVMMARPPYNNRTTDYIVADIVTNGLTGEGVEAVASGGPTVAALTIDDYTYVADALDRVAQAVSSATAAYSWKFDPWRRLVFQADATTPAPWNISDADASDGNILISLKITRTREKYSNHAYIAASKTLSSPITESYHGLSTLGSPATKAFTTTKTPALAPTAKVNGVTVQVDETTVDPQDPGTWPDSWIVNISGTAVTLVSGNPFTSGMTGKTVYTNNDLFIFTFVDGSHGTLNRSAGTLTSVAFYLAPTVPVGAAWGWITGTNRLWTDIYHSALGSGDTIAITYQTASEQRAFSAYAAGVDERSTVEGGTGYWETIVKVDNPVSQEEVAALADSVAERYGQIPTKVEIQTYRPGLAVGQSITLHMTEVAGSFTITSTRMVTEGGWPKWSVTATNGSIIGDWRTALVGGFNGSAGVAGGGGAGVTIGNTSVATSPGSGALSLVYPNTPGQVGVPYSMSPVASGGTAPYGFTIVTGSLSGTGLSLDGTTGELSGTPTTAGFVSVTIRVTDAATATQDFAVSIAVASPSGNPIVVGTSTTLPRANDITALSVAPGLNNQTDFPYDKTTANGNHYASIAWLALSDAGCAGDPNAYRIIVTARDKDASGNYIGPEQTFWTSHVGAAAGSGNTYTFGPLDTAYGTDGYSYVRSGELYSVEFAVYVVNATDESPQAWSNTAAARLQNTIGVSGRVEVAVAKAVQDTAHGGKRAPLGTFDRVDRTNTGGGLQYDPHSGRLVSNNDNLAASLIQDPSFEFASPGYLGTSGIAPGWNWGIVPGSIIEIRNDGGNSASNYARLTGKDASLTQTITVQPGLTFYLSIAVRSSNSGAAGHAVGIYVNWLDANNAVLSPYTTIVGTVSGYVSAWTANAASGFVTAPAGAAKAIIKISTSASEPALEYWDVDDVLMQAVINQTANGQTASTVPAAGSTDYSAIRATTTADASNSYYGRKFAQVTAPNGTDFAYMSAVNGSANFLASVAGVGQANLAGGLVGIQSANGQHGLSFNVNNGGFTCVVTVSGTSHFVVNGETVTTSGGTRTIRQGLVCQN